MEICYQKIKFMQRNVVKGMHYKFWVPKKFSWKLTNLRLALKTCCIPISLFWDKNSHLAEI